MHSSPAAPWLSVVTRSGDPYLQQSRDVALHCLPIVTLAKLVGVLYLESHIAVGAFTPQRAAVLDLLAAQAAISLENARLYADLQRSEAFLVEGESISQTGSWSWDAHTGKVIWSDEHYRILGIEPGGGSAPTPAHVFRMVHPEDRTALLRILQPSIRNRDTFTREYRLNSVGWSAAICMLSADPPRRAISAPWST